MDGNHDMNLRLSGQSIRFRISEDELSELRKTGELTTKTRFGDGAEEPAVGDGQALSYTIRVANSGSSPLSVSFKENSILLLVSRPALEELADQVPSGEGISYQETCLEVDLRSARRPKG